MSTKRFERGLRANFIGLGINLVLVGSKLAAGILDRVRSRFPAVHDVLVHIEPAPQE